MLYQTTSEAFILPQQNTLHHSLLGRAREKSGPSAFKWSGYIVWQLIPPHLPLCRGRGVLWRQFNGETRIQVLGPKPVPSFPIRHRLIVPISLHIYKQESFPTRYVCFSRALWKYLTCPDFTFCLANSLGMDFFPLTNHRTPKVWCAVKLSWRSACKHILQEARCLGRQTTSLEEMSTDSATAAPRCGGNRNIYLVFYGKLHQTIRVWGGKRLLHCKKDAWVTGEADTSSCVIKTSTVHTQTCRDGQTQRPSLF